MTLDPPPNLSLLILLATLATGLAAGTDRLTGAWNRRRFEDGAMQLIALASRRGGRPQPHPLRPGPVQAGQ